MRTRLVLLAGVVLASLLPGSAMAQVANPGLNQVLEEVRKAYNKSERPMVIFDLEGTLFDNRSRILQILKEYGEQELKAVRPQFAQALNNINVMHVQYMLTDTLAAAGVNEPDVVNNAAVFWSQRFFTDEY